MGGVVILEGGYFDGLSQRLTMMMGGWDVAIAVFLNLLGVKPINAFARTAFEVHGFANRYARLIGAVLRRALTQSWLRF